MTITDPYKEIHALREESQKLKERLALPCPACGGDPLIASMAKLCGHRPDIAFRKASRYCKALEDIRTDVNEWRRLFGHPNHPMEDIGRIAQRALDDE